MKIIVFLGFIGLSLAAPQAPPPSQLRTSPVRNLQEIRTLRFDNVNNGDGSYNYGYETENGITVEEQGILKAPRSADEEAIQAVKGFFQYYAPEGQKLRVDYTADENGFDAKGDHLPTPPPIPEAIMRSLAILYSNAEKQKQQQLQPQRRF